MNITVDILENNMLTRNRYTFMLLDIAVRPRLIFNEYGEFTRTTKRHGFKLTGRVWDRLDKRRCNIAIRPDIPESVKIEAKAKLFEAIKYDF